MEEKSADRSRGHFRGTPRDDILSLIETCSTKLKEADDECQKIHDHIAKLQDAANLALAQRQNLEKILGIERTKLATLDFGNRMKELGKYLELDDVTINDFPMFKKMSSQDQDLVLESISWKILNRPKYTHMYRSGGGDITYDLVLTPEEYRDRTYDVIKSGSCSYCLSIYHQRETGPIYNLKRCPKLDRKFCIVCQQKGHTASECNVRLRDLPKFRPRFRRPKTEIRGRGRPLV